MLLLSGISNPRKDGEKNNTDPTILELKVHSNQSADAQAQEARASASCIEVLQENEKLSLEKGEKRTCSQDRSTTSIAS